MASWQQAIVTFATIGVFTTIYFAWFFLMILIDGVKEIIRRHK